VSFTGAISLGCDFEDSLHKCFLNIFFMTTRSNQWVHQRLWTRLDEIERIIGVVDGLYLEGDSCRSHCLPVSDIMEWEQMYV